MGTHGSYAIEKRRSGCVAVCDCGWRSERAYSAGAAGSVWDAHVAATAREPRRAAIAEALERVRNGPRAELAPGIVVPLFAVEALERLTV